LLLFRGSHSRSIQLLSFSGYMPSCYYFYWYILNLGSMRLKTEKQKTQ
jgi:hypothetical protein